MEAIPQLNVGMALFVKITNETKKTLFHFSSVYFIAPHVINCINATQISKTVIYQMPSAEQGSHYVYILCDIHLKGGFVDPGTSVISAPTCS